MEWIIVLLIGVLAGIVSGMVGIGGGLIVVPALVFFFGMGQHMAQGTSLAMMLPPIGALAVYNYYKTGQVDFKIALILCLSFVVGSFFGSKIALGISESVIKKLFGIFMLAVGIKLILNK